MSRWLVSAAHRSSGKTTVSIGLCAALRRRGLSVQPFKKGPDYIDPMWLTLAAGRACRNLDPHLAGPGEIEAAFLRHAHRADASLVEGNLGLHDGMAADGSDSNAALACRLGLPAVLVLDTRGTARGIAPLVLGYQAFEPRLRIAGVILNRVGGARHERRLREALERYTDVPVLGAIGENPRLAIVERHLGLVPGNEAQDAARIVETLAEAVAAGVDLDALLAATATHVAEPEPHAASPLVAGPSTAALPAAALPADEAPLRIGIARDEAFGFYYVDDLEALQAAGAELVPFDTLRDAAPPEVDGLFIGGGFPETLAARLAANHTLRSALRERIEAGLPVYAECGGLMYLARSIRWHGERHEMVGAIPADVVMHERAVGRGYVTLRETDAFPWPGGPVATVHGHEFHHSGLENVAPGLRHAYRVVRGHGIDGSYDGIVHRNVLASYAHLRSVGGNRWPQRFVQFVRGVALARRERPTLTECTP
ncbi:MAG: cobyrinate a,c-diamide synthase [Lautropia sp.]|nr:cobyrinate a,c-diamide synthase [Lautropia sp.]MCZ2413867.1 cobyrinate a,c-diamide synthase [Burkholderiales bacterium]MDL1907130.1 cobyrinate a,c-diamide synthase [Betaproteobacteria bacterium PRO1]